jgi:glycerophosphoryl diester phosphodiesterase
VSVGCDHIETDVQLSRDGEVVIFHDERLDESTTGTGRIADHDWDTLRDLRYVDEDGPTEHGPTLLADALDEFPEAFFNIDVKTDDAIEPTIDVLRTRRAADRVCVAAFGWRRLRTLRNTLGEGWCTACSQVEIVVLRLLSLMRLPLPRFGDAVQVPERKGRLRVVDRAFVAACHRSDVEVHVWTVNEREQADRLDGLGVDTIITDHPDLFLDWRTA